MHGSMEWALQKNFSRNQIVTIKTSRDFEFFTCCTPIKFWRRYRSGYYFCRCCSPLGLIMSIFAGVLLAFGIAAILLAYLMSHPTSKKLFSRSSLILIKCWLLTNGRSITILRDEGLIKIRWNTKRLRMFQSLNSYFWLLNFSSCIVKESACYDMLIIFRVQIS